MLEHERMHVRHVTCCQVIECRRSLWFRLCWVQSYWYVCYVRFTHTSPIVAAAVLWRSVRYYASQRSLPSVADWWNTMIQASLPQCHHLKWKKLAWFIADMQVCYHRCRETSSSVRDNFHRSLYKWRSSTSLHPCIAPTLSSSSFIFCTT